MPRMAYIAGTTAAAIVFAVALFQAATAAAETANGFVYEDANSNAQRDDGEAGLGGIMVSNGREIAKTESDGRYSIQVAQGDVLFVIKPTGYMTPVDGNQLPQFHYIHSPNGTPQEIVLRYPGIEPTGPLPASIDFGLTAQDEEGPFEVILFADTQPQSDVEIDFIRDDVVAELIGTSAAFAVTVGDIMFDDLALFPRYNAVMSQMGIPVYNVPGNHELNFLSPDDKHSLESYKRLIGPPTYAWAYGDVHFIAIDNVDYKGFDAGRDEPTYRGNGMYEGHISSDALTFIESYVENVAKGERIVILHHIPLRTYQDPSRPAMNTLNKEDLFKVLSGHTVYAAHGHTHTTEHHYFGPEDGFDGPQPLHSHVLTTVSGSWWSGPNDARGIATAMQRDGTPNGYHITRFDGADMSVRFKPASMPHTHQMRIMFDSQFHQMAAPIFKDYRHGGLTAGRITADQAASTDILVNFFDGGPKTTLTVSVNGTNPLPMARVNEPDPLAHELFERFASVRKPWVNAEKVSHLYRVDLPSSINVGANTITVVATDEFGMMHEQSTILEISATAGKL
ncbi:MAG: calcineurin-like phosphoesterase C-terminal domain-containing protein [Candidatus Phaeomarinobacter sp.]